jgi:integrase/recombinase XerD
MSKRFDPFSLQVKKLLGVIDTTAPDGYRDRTILELLYSTGIRVGELIGLNCEDVDYPNTTMLVNGKGDKQRVVPIGRTALRYLESYTKAVRGFLVRNPAEPALFLNGHGERIKRFTIAQHLHRYAARAGLDVNVTPHTFRRSCTTELIRSGANFYHVKELLGHESLDTVRHYAKLTIQDLKATHAKCHPRERKGG